MLAGLCLLNGCTNKPGALTMKFEPASESYRADEPIRLTCELRAGTEPVCLSKNRWFDVELSGNDKGGPLIATRRPGEAVARCGTGIAETMILMPWLVGAAYLDVSDAGGRYDVVTAGGRRLHKLLVWPNKVEAEFVRLACDEDRGQRSEGGNRLPPGEYDVTLRLRNARAFCGDFLPHPIGWKPYDQPVEAKVSIRVIDTESSLRPAASAE